jgi:Family of unknown function (DUF5762)
MNTTIKFWLEDPSILVSDLVFLPTVEMTREQKLNALTRLAVAVTVVMYLTECEYWSTFLLTSMLAIVVMQYMCKIKDKKVGKEGFTVVPTRISDDFQTTVVAPVFAEEVRVPPPAYDMYTNVAYEEPPFDEPIRPQAYPYGQYLTRTNLLPSDEYFIAQNPTGGARQAREYANSKFLQHDMAFREDMTRIFKKKLARQFRHTENDTWSPFSSY